VLLFQPDPTTGRFEVVKQPTFEDMVCNGIFFDGFSTFIVGQTGTGLDAADIDEYRMALEKCNIAWLIMQFGATHPQYHPHALTDPDFDYSEAYRGMCAQPPGDFTVTREEFSEFKLTQHLFGEERPSLYDLWHFSETEGQKRGLHDGCQAIIASGTGTYERINRPVDLQFVHIYPHTFAKVRAETDLLNARHAKMPDATMGPFVVRLGRIGVGCMSLEHVAMIGGLKNDKRKREKYAELYPGNEVFLADFHSN
jgi:hypothetical protein